MKLWVNEWLDGTTRFQLAPTERLFWVDLLALAGRSRWPGIVAAGMDGERFVGYSISYLRGITQSKNLDVVEAVHKFEKTHKVTAEFSRKAGQVFVVIRILNWEKYQSEYIRQAKYRKVTTSDTQRLPVEGEVEGEVEGDVTPIPPLGFDDFWNCYPRKVGKADAKRAWKRHNPSVEEVLLGLSLWVKTEQWQKEAGKFIPYPATFLRREQWKEPPTISPHSKEAAVGSHPAIPLCLECNKALPPAHYPYCGNCEPKVKARLARLNAPPTSAA